MAYGFDINVGGDVLIQMKRIQVEMAALTATVDVSTHEIQEDFKETASSVNELGKVFAEVFAVREIIHFGEELMHVAAEFEGFNNVIKYSSLNGYDATQNMDYLAGAITRLHLPMEQATEGFSEMQAGLIGTGIEGQRLRNLFEGISTASTVLHLSQYNLKRTLYDFKEIGEIGLNQRIVKSLQTALPGVGEIVKESFHKTIAELEKEHMSGGQVLLGLSTGLQEHFQPGLANAGSSLISQMNDMQTAVTKLKLELGDNLRPVFIEIMNTIKNIFNSGLVKEFVANIRPLAELLIDVTKIWIEYKGAIMLAEGAMKAYGIIAAAVELVQVGLAGQMTLTEIALEGLSGAFTTTGIGAFAVLIGYLVETFIQLNEEIDKAVEKITNLAAVQGGSDRLSNEFQKVTASYRNNSTLSADEKGENLNDINALADRIGIEMRKNTLPSLQAAEDALDAHEKKYPRTNKMAVQQEIPLVEAITKLKETYSKEQDQVKTLQSYSTQARLAGIKPFKQKAMPTGQADAMNTSHLAGASGGLGEAKVIQIHFHAPFQENIVENGGDLSKHGQVAIQQMIRMLNNLALSQSTTQ